MRARVSQVNGMILNNIARHGSCEMQLRAHLKQNTVSCRLSDGTHSFI